MYYLSGVFFMLKLVKLEELINLNTGKLDSNHAIDKGKYPFFTCAPEPLNIDSYSFDEKAILLAGNNANGIFHINYYEGKFDAYQRTYVITIKNEDILNIKYLFHALKLCLLEFRHISQGTSTKFLTKKILNNFRVNVPDIIVQNQIVEILDSIDKKIELNNKINNKISLFV